MPSDWLSRLLRAWLVTAVTDALFSSCLVKFAYGSTVTRLWQGVASVPFGPTMLEGGTRTALIGLAMHFSVALTWSIVFLLLYSSHCLVRTIASRPAGVIGLAVVYGPIIWLFMSFVLIPHFTHKPPTVNYRWWVQFFGHMPFVALPIVAMISRRTADPSLGSG
jgi:hypothetical protein